MQSAKIDFLLDTNVLIYAASGRIDAPRKFDVASRLVLSGSFAVTGQTLAEFCSASHRKKLLPPEDVDRWLYFLGRLPFVPVDQSYVHAGFTTARHHRISYFDAALLAAAERVGAPVFYSEDLNHNQVYGSVRVVNPFL